MTKKGIYGLAGLLFSSVLYAQKQDSIPAKGLMDEVVVTGQYERQTLKSSVHRVRVISQEQIKLRGANDILSVMNTELGIRFNTDYTLGETDIQLLGMDGQNVKILLDGVPLVDRGSTRQALSQIDINTVERVEIVEGPMSVVYGTDALAGVINIITKKNTAASKNQWNISARVQEETVPKEYDAFSGKGIHNQNVNIGWTHKDGLYLNGSYSRNEFGGWQGNEQGRAKEWKPKMQHLFGGTIGYRKDGLNVWYRLNYLNEELKGKGIYNTDPQYGRVASDQAFITDRYTHLLQADWRINEKWSVNASGSYQDYERRTRNTLHFEANGKDYLNPRATQDISTFVTTFFRATALYRWNDKVNIQPGFEYKLDQTTGQRIHGEPDITDISAFISAELKPIAKLNIRPGIRYSNNSVYDAPPVIPSLNVKYDLNDDWSLRGSYGRGFRAPALRELYFTFHDASHNIEGNPDLKAEYSNSYSISYTRNKFMIGNVTASADLALFYNDYRDRIIYAQHPTQPTWSTLQNQEKYKTQGGTLTGNFIYENLKTNVGVAYVGRYNAFYTSDKDLDQFLWSPEVNANVAYIFPKLGLNMALFYKYTGKLPNYIEQNNSFTQTEVEAYHYADFTLGKTLGKYLSLNTGVKNLFDVVRLNNTDPSSGGHSTAGPLLKSYGRTFFVGLLFNWKN